jgi:uncharacterized membrane protein YeaQ/YmgE (transglycosylase-associated protein family)
MPSTLVLLDDPVISAFGYHITLTHTLIVYLIVAAVVGLITETLVGWRLPFGIIGAMLASLVGIWLITNVIPINITGGDMVIAGQSVPLAKAFIGAFIVVGLWHLLTYPAWRERRRYSYGRRYRRRYDREYY